MFKNVRVFEYLHDDVFIKPADFSLVQFTIIQFVMSPSYCAGLQSILTLVVRTL